PGGHRRVAADDLLKFLRQHKMPIPRELGAAPMQILIVDDEPGITRLISKAIRAAHSDFKVVEAHDGFRAGTLVATLHPDVVILDLRMPTMDGYEVCRMIKSHESTEHTEVIAITAYPSPEAEAKILECGAKICLEKPLNMEKLLKEVEKLLRI
ncbi:MAG: response regulator, partial [Phycisphaerae bacterium]|nr:response regulator [Phycisphaerae bacterium]